MKYIKQVLGNDLRQYTMVVALAALIIIFNIISGGRMLTSSNFQNLISGNAYVLILALGMLMVIVIGQIDLSVGSVAGFAGMVMALVAKNYNVPWWCAVLIAIAIGLLAGAWHGFFLSQLGIPGFITTLGGMMIFRGGVIWISHSISVPAPEQLKWFGSGYLPEWGPTFTGMNNSTLLLGIIGIVVYIVAQIRKYKRSGDATGVKDPLWAVVVRIILMTVLIGYFTWLFGSGRVGTSFPVPGLILLLLTVIYHIITQRTKFGRHVYAVGGNKAAAALSGVNVKRTYFLTMMNMSFLAAVAGILFVGRSTAAGPADGTSWEMDAIASVFIGGAAVSGGVGTILATIVGGLVMAVLNNGLMLMGVGADKTQVIKGFVLLAAVAFDVYNKKSGKSSIIGRLFPSKGEKAAN
ncbi:MAG: sugar ABC transporter permease [Lachnospiraceae bacterium]|jgi:putative multiple sugar transport system permease protein|nr:sugar ABC transporter permease [Lachnospiraceae bacterium]